MNSAFPLPTGLLAVTGGERTGKTSLLRRLCGELPALAGESSVEGALWLDLSQPGQDQQTPLQVWATLQAHCPQWNAALLEQLVDALALSAHTEKQLFMLSTGSRRKVALAGLLASGAKVTCLDQPYAALDRGSIAVIRDFLAEMADHPSRTWVVADYEADPLLPWARAVSLD